MEHNEYKEMIQFYLYEELDVDKRKLFEEHLKSCNDCKLELESYKKLFAEILKDSQSPLDPKLLMEARLELRGLLRAQRNQVSFLHKIIESIYFIDYKTNWFSCQRIISFIHRDVNRVSRIQNTGN